VSYYKPRKIKLLSHQKTGVQFLLKRPLAGLFDIMGLGKTMQILCAMQTLIDERKIDGVVVVCKRQHADVWIDEINSHFKMPIHSVVGMPPEERKQVWPVHQHGVFIINYALLSRSLANKQEYDKNTMLRLRNGAILKSPDALNLAQLLMKKRIALVLDESQYIANHKAKVTKVLHGLSYYAERRIIATGTPVAERPDNLWSQLFFVDHGNVLGPSYNSFINQHAIFVGSMRRRWISRFTNLSSLRRKVEKVSLRRTEDDCPDLPPLVHMYSNHTAKGKQKALLSKERRDMITSLIAMSERYLSAQKGTSFSKMLQRVLIASAMPCVLDPNVKDSAKFDELLDVLDSIGTNEQVVVWSVHRKVADAVAEQLNAMNKKVYSAELIHGGVTHNERRKRLKLFKEGGCRVLSATMATLREAVSLPEARHGFYIQRDFSLMNWSQSQKRHHRLTSTKKVVIHVPLLQGTLDEYINNHLKEKHADAVTSTDRDVQIALDRRSLLAALKRSV